MVQASLKTRNCCKQSQPFSSTVLWTYCRSEGRKWLGLQQSLWMQIIL